MKAFVIGLYIAACFMSFVLGLFMAYVPALVLGVALFLILDDELFEDAHTVEVWDAPQG